MSNNYTDQIDTTDWQKVYEKYQTKITMNMFKCECYPNHEICKNKNTCEFRIPLNPELLQIYHQLKYKLAELNTLKQRKQDYHAAVKNFADF